MSEKRSLDACWHFLRSPDGSRYLGALEHRLREERYSLEHELPPMGLVDPESTLPRDRFERALVLHHQQLASTPHAEWWSANDSYLMDVAAVMALGKAAGKDGLVTRDKMRTAFGDDGAAIYERLRDGVAANTFRGNAKAKYRLMPRDAR